MKKPLKSFVTFTRTERLGLMCLCGLILILIAVRATMPMWAAPKPDKDNEQKLIAAWEVFKRSQPAPKTGDTATHTRKDFQKAFDDIETPLPDTLDLNTVDSATLVRLKGIGPVTAGNIVARRTKKGLYTDFSQLSEVGSFSADNLALLKKHLVISKNKPDSK